MQDTANAETDPLRWCLGITLIYALLVGWRLGIPSLIYFDEVHYVPAARKLLALLPANPEHPLVGKEAIALAIRLFGDAPAVWRLPSAVMGTLGLFGFGRALWWATRRRFATIAGMVLLASDFTWFVQSRIAMLDMVMAGLAMVALWQVAAAIALPKDGPRWRARLHMGVAGVTLGLALGAKWSVLPLVLGVPLGLIAARIVWAGRRAITASNVGPVKGMTLPEIAFWTISLPLAAYYASFTPIFLYREGAVAPWAIVPWHIYMAQLQESVIKHHPYQSVWWQWAINWRPIWYLYQVVDGSQRGVLLLGNPFTMLAGLAAMVWCLARGAGRRRWPDVLAALAYLATLGLWMVHAKPVQFYYHYLLPGALLMACLALALDALWRKARARWWRWAAVAPLVLSLALFAGFFPILAALPLHHGARSFETWMWLPSWR